MNKRRKKYLALLLKIHEIYYFTHLSINLGKYFTKILAHFFYLLFIISNIKIKGNGGFPTLRRVCKSGFRRKRESKKRFNHSNVRLVSTRIIIVENQSEEKQYSEINS